MPPDQVQGIIHGANDAFQDSARRTKSATSGGSHGGAARSLGGRSDPAPLRHAQPSRHAALALAKNRAALCPMQCQEKVLATQPVSLYQGLARALSAELLRGPRELLQKKSIVFAYDYL